MSTRKYRLAPPVDTGKVAVSYRTTLPTPSNRLYRVTLSNDAELSSKRELLKNKKTLEKASLTSSPRWWLVLPSVLFIILASASDPLLMNDLIVRRYERQYGLPTSAGAQRTACRQSSTTPPPNGPMMYWQLRPPDQYPMQQHPDYNLVQRDAASFNIKNSIATLVPAVIIFLLLGSNSDIIGRRPLLVLPFVGKVVRYTLMLIIVSLNLSDAWLIAAHALEAVFGAGGLVVLSAFSYITDCTGASRTRAFLLTEVFIVIARILPILAVSLWLRRYLYTGPLSVDLTLSVMGLLYGIFVLPESVESV